MSSNSDQIGPISLISLPAPAGKKKIVSLDARHSDEEQDRISLVVQNQFADLMRNSKFSEAAVLVGKVIESFPGTWRPVEERESCTVRAFWDEAEFDAYTAKHPSSDKPVVWGMPSLSQLFYMQGAAYARDIRFDLAHMCLVQGIEYEPDHPRLWIAKGLLLNWEDKFTEALEAFRTAATVRSWTPPHTIASCLHGQGVSFGALGLLPEARDAFARACELDPDNEQAQTDLQRVLHDLERRKLSGGATNSVYLM